MRRLFVAAIAAAGLAGVLAHDSHPVSRRKTLSFGPVLPHAAYHTNPVYHSSLLRAEDPFEVARSFVDDLVRDIPGGSYQIRKDSYTDQATGVTHIYARQYVNGIEVADGDINLNVKDGIILSYGDSFPSKLASTRTFRRDLSPHSEYCQSLEREIAHHLQPPHQGLNLEHHYYVGQQRLRARRLRGLQRLGQQSLARCGCGQGIRVWILPQGDIN